LKIFHILNHFLPHQTAGTEVYTWALCKKLQQKGIDVEIIIPNYGHKDSASYKYDELHIFQYAEPSIVDRTLILGFRKPVGLKNFEEYIKLKSPDIVHFHELAGSNGITLHHIIAAKNTGAKIIMTFHLANNTCITGKLLYKEHILCDGLINLQKCSKCYLHGKGNSILNSILLPVSSGLFQLGIDSTSWNNKFGTALGTIQIIERLKNNFELLIQHCDKVIAIADWYKKILMLNGVPEEKINYIPQGLAYDENISIPPSNKKIGPLKLLFLGRISPFKGLHLLLDAIINLPNDKVELDIYGQSIMDNYENEWRIKTATFANIHWKGKLEQNQVVNTMQQYDLLCVCSTFSEMSPLIIQEAFAAGLPVIASEVYGNAEQIKHNINGLLFRFKEVDSLKEQLLRCMNDYKLITRLKSNISRPRNFSEVSEQYFQLYQNLLS